MFTFKFKPFVKLVAAVAAFAVTAAFVALILASVLLLIAYGLNIFAVSNMFTFVARPLTDDPLTAATAASA